MKENNKADVGVVVGRFQVNDLHHGHKDLINSVANSHNRLIIVLGLSPCKCTFNNPLDFESRKAMLQEHYPDATIVYIKDIHDDMLWSEDLDGIISSLIGPSQTACLYGSRESFIPYYSGKFETKELVQERYYSGTEVRKQLSVKANKTKDFRSGAIWAMQNQWPGPKMCVDIAILSNDNTKILLGRKKREEQYRFVGGFVQNNESLEEAALRESKEETHLDIKKLSYITSAPINDWRYVSERDKITTVLFSAYIEAGTPSPDDDINELRWFELDGNIFHILVPNHKVLASELLRAIKGF